MKHSNCCPLLGQKGTTLRIVYTKKFQKINCTDILIDFSHDNRTKLFNILHKERNYFKECLRQI